MMKSKISISEENSFLLLFLALKTALQTKKVSELVSLRIEINMNWKYFILNDRKKIKNEISKNIKNIPTSERKNWENILYR